MARPRRRTRLSVSLFPFLSILACVMGTLILLITASATSQVASGGIDLERYEQLEQEIEANRRRLAELSGLSEELSDLAASLDEARAREQKLAARREELHDVLSKSVPQREALRADEARVARLERELEPLRAENTRLRGELAEREAKRGEGKIRIRPSGSGLGLEPHFVECRPEGIVLYEGLGHERREIPAHLVQSSPEYARFLRDALFRSNASVIFLIREGGVETYDEARPLAQRHRVRFGEIPLVGSGELDFGALRGGGAS
jgi:hypothetical protein